MDYAASSQPNAQNTYRYYDNGTSGIGFARVSSGSTFVELYKVDSSAWASGAVDDTHLEGNLQFEIT